MSDVNTFIDTIGKDVSATVVPKIESLAATISTKTFTEYGPRVSAFANQLVKDIIDEQSATVRDFVTGLIQEICQRYRPELAGELKPGIGGVAWR
jgi:NADPH-dependent curcumin reductase CurA